MVATTFTETIPLRMNKDGVILVGKTRVTLDTLITAFSEGATAEEISYQYPSVSLADIYSVIGYYLRKKKQLDAYLKRREKLAQEVRRQNEENFNLSCVREKLLSLIKK